MAKTKKRPKRLAKTTKIRYKSTIKRRRPAHKKVLLHPSTIIVLLIFGGWLILSSLHVSAASYLVTAIVPAPLPTGPAIITNPVDQDSFNYQPITVSGTCPTPTYVELFDNNGFGGVVNCASDGTFSLQIQLVIGTNVLSAEVFNITDQEGPTSPTVTVYYNPVTPTTTTTTPTITKQPTTIKPIPPTGNLAFVLRSSYHYQVFSTGKLVQLPVTIIGGSAPYGITVTWGDGQLSTIVRSNAGLFQISHTYYGGNNGLGSFTR